MRPSRYSPGVTLSGSVPMSIDILYEERKRASGSRSIVT